MKINDITGCVIESAIEIHRELGPGLLESAYKNVLNFELQKKRITTLVEHPVPLIWQEVKLEAGFRADLIVEGQVIVEVKSVVEIHPVHKKQLLTYLRLAEKPIGLLINFNVELLKNGISRILNNIMPQNKK